MEIEQFKESFRRDGFCVVPSVFTAAEVAEMRSVNDEVISRALRRTGG